MSWFAEEFKKRVPVTVDNNGGSATIDVSITIPADFGAFWANVASNGHDIKLVDSDGITELTWQRQTWDYANKSAVLEIDAWSPDSDNATVVCYLYWQYDGTPSDTSGSFTAASAKTGTVQAGVVPVQAEIVRTRAPSTETDVPDFRYSWPPDQSGYLVFDVGRWLARQAEPYEGSQYLEEIAYITVETRNGGVTYAGGNTPAKTRMSQWGGRTLVYMWVTGSADDADYIDEITVTTSTGRVFIWAALRVAYTATEPG